MDLSFEKKEWEKGRRLVFGVDEAGRGPLSGPVTACALVVKKEKLERRLLEEVNDSKKVSPKRREELFEVFSSHPFIDFEVSWTTPQVIDRINILEATKRAMERAVQKLETRVGKSDLVFIDGNITLKLERLQRGVRGGDGRVFSCGAASIAAKVFRDRTMKRYHRLFPEYRFDRHKGYPTKLHRERIKKYGPCRIHRESFNLAGN